MNKTEISIMDLSASTEEIDIFNTSTVQEVIMFKWNTFGWAFHLVGGLFHTFYMVVLIIYNILVYYEGKGKPLSAGDDPSHRDHEHSD